MRRTAVLAICVLLAPAIASADPDDEDPRDPVNAPILTAGALVFLGSYGAAVGVATARLHDGNDQLYIPIAGPWLALGDWCTISSASCEASPATKALLVADGLVQAAGLVIMLDAFFEPSHRTQPDRCVHIAPKHDGFVVFGRF